MDKPSYFDQFDNAPQEIIAEAFGEMRTIKQNDVVLPDGNFIDMSFFMETGIPVEQNWVMKDWNINFNIIRDTLPKAVDVLKKVSTAVSVPVVKKLYKYLSHCLCTEFYSLILEDQYTYNFGFTCIDLHAGGSVTDVCVGMTKGSDLVSEILFKNSSFEQYIKTLALYIVHHNNMEPTITLDDFVYRNDLFVEYVKKIDPMALKSEQSETFWTRVIGLLRSEEFEI